jgi:peptidoglycan/LPS O-acetylase OafA/YrhL
MPEPVEGASPYLPGLDGIRAIAVLAVIGYHLDPALLPGGLLGVGVFFVLSGYLITDLLLAGYERAGRVDLKGFWARRARRLLPALFVMLFVVLGWVTLFDHSELGAIRSDLLPAILYVSNWWFIFHHVSYFARFGPPSPLGHLWSLAVEEQFYLLWPFVVMLGVRYVRTLKARLTVVACAAMASALEMALLYSPDGNPTRVYDGTDTRAFALLMGAALALIWPRERRFGPIDSGARRLLEATGVVVLAGMAVMFWQTNQYQAFLYRGGMVLLSALAGILILVTVHPGARVGRVLGWRPLRWVGARSYAIYLWHYPVIVLTTPLDASPSFLRASLQVGASLLLAEASWRLVEEPARHGALERAFKRAKQQLAEAGLIGALRLRRIGVLRVAGSLLVAANLVVCVVGLSGLVQSGTELASEEAHYHDILPRPRHGRPERGVVLPRVTGGVPAASSTTTSSLPAGSGVTAIGDSLMVDAAPYLEQHLPGIVIDAKVGAQLYQVQEQVPELKAEGDVGDRLVVELGTNGPYSAAQLTSFLESFGPMKRIVLVNTRVDRPWEEEVNQTIASVAATYPHARLVNWYQDSAGHPQYFYPDGVHLDPEGASYYASLITAALEAPSKVQMPPRIPPSRKPPPRPADARSLSARGSRQRPRR